ncbi:adenylyl-sulfate kinase [Streptomyces mirabilis]|uniref:adenylyl-sulfate kinase n=1 Tax=Streptomyces mirabilis TaxID=68239 RepID=UPI00367C2F55
MTTTARAQGATVWLTGLPSAGKTTIARILGTRLKAEGHRVEVLDGDEVRRFLSAGLGFSREDRNTNVQRIGLVAEVLARNGVLAVVPVIAPYADSRDAVRERHEASGTPYIEVHVATPVEVCSERDVKQGRRTRVRAAVTNDLGRITLRTAEPLALDDYADVGRTGAFLLVDPADGSTLTAGMADLSR